MRDAAVACWMLRGDSNSAAIVVWVEGITRQRSTTTSRHEVVRYACSALRGELLPVERVIRGFNSAAGALRRKLPDRI